MTMKNEIKISIIIPVYNAEKYLKYCLDTLKMQTYDNLEILLIDDWSKDSSLKICKHYSDSDKRFKTFSKKNWWTSSARNLWIKYATWDYITFIDNDDYLNDKKCYENIINTIEKNNNPDIVCSNPILFFEDKDKYLYPKIFKTPETNDFYEALTYFIEKWIYSYTVRDKVISSKLIKNNNILFSEGKRNEDSEFCIKLLENAQSIYYYNKPYYIYRKNHSYAQTSKLKEKEVDDLKNLILFYINKYWHKKNKLSILIINYLAYLYAVYIAQVTILGKSSEIIEIKKYKDLLKYDLNKDMKKVCFIYKIFGFDITRRTLAFYLKKRYNLNK